MNAECMKAGLCYKSNEVVDKIRKMIELSTLFKETFFLTLDFNLIEMLLKLTQQDRNSLAICTTTPLLVSTFPVLEVVCNFPDMVRKVLQPSKATS